MRIRSIDDQETIFKSIRTFYILFILALSLVGIALVSVRQIGYPRFGILNGFIGFSAGIYLRVIAENKDNVDENIANLFFIGGFFVACLGLAGFIHEEIGVYIRLILFSLFLLAQVLAFMYYIIYELNEDIPPLRIALPEDVENEIFEETGEEIMERKDNERN